jgi:hypothetical protein
MEKKQPLQQELQQIWKQTSKSGQYESKSPKKEVLSLDEALFHDSLVSYLDERKGFIIIPGRRGEGRRERKNKEKE